MNKFYAILLATLFCIFSLSNNTFAQVNFGINFNYTQPVKTYKDNLSKNPMGFMLDAFVPIQQIKGIYVGGELGVSMYANEKYFLELQEGELAGEMIEIDEEDCFFRYGLFIRYLPIEGKKINPYLETSLGAVSFFSTRMADEEYDNYFKSETTFHGTSLNIALATGVIVRLSDLVSIDMKVQANNGSKTYYRSVDSADASLSRSLDYGRQSSSTNHFNYSLGILFGF